MRLLLLLAVACGPAAPAPDAPALWPALGSIEYFVGRWDARVDSRNATITSIDWNVEPGVGGRWLAGRATARPAGIEARDYWTVEPSGSIVRLYLDSGGTFGELRSPGWKGDEMIFEGTLTSEGQAVRVREGIRRLGPDRFRAEWQMEIDGAWVTSSTELLERAR